jgi:alpha-tubulin suppressor-like RCC1 family protein
MSNNLLWHWGKTSEFSDDLLYSPAILNFIVTSSPSSSTLASSSSSSSPPPPPSLHVPSSWIHFSHVALGRSHIIALDIRGNVYTWGLNHDGQLGSSDRKERRTPFLIETFPSGSRALSISAGESHSLALLNDGSIFSWGANTDGQLGREGTRGTPMPIDLRGVKVRSISSGRSHNVCLTPDGVIYGWGSGNYLSPHDNS